MNKKLYWFVGVLVGIILLLAITNPSAQRMRKYIKEPTSDKISIERNNYLLFSLYTINGTDGTRGADFYQYKYMGIFGTFFGDDNKIYHVIVRSSQ